MATVSLHVIAKDEVGHIRRIVKDYSRYFDAIDIAIDSQEAMDILTKEFPTVNFYKYEWIRDFADKRNFLKSKCKSDYYFRIDTDDIIRNPEKLDTVLEKAVQHNIDVILTWYEYARDFDGNVHAAHWRETIIKTNSKHKWNKKIHENVVPDNPTSWNIVLEKGIVIEHMLDAAGAEMRKKRNLEYLIEEYSNTKDTPDPRTLAYLGRMLYPMGKLSEAKFFLEEHIRLSGWDEDKMKSWVMLADIMSDSGEHQQAIGACYEALNERSDFPDPYLKISEIYNRMSNWKQSIHWGLLGLKQENPHSTTLYDPSSYTWKPSIILAHSYLMSDDVVNAKKYFDMAKKLVPNLGWITQNEKLFIEALEQKDFLDRFVWLLRFTREKEPQNIEALFNIIPKHLKNHEILVKLKQQHAKPKLWATNEIAIYCGQAWEEWAAPSVINGIGGSEEAVIYLSKELTNLGYKVTVFCSCGELEGEYEGVTYKPYYEFNNRDDHNIVISWRHNICGAVPSAKKRFVWLHDVPTENQFSSKDLESIDKIIVLSQFHKSLLKNVPENKIFVSSNGINLPDFNLKKPVERNPHRIIYTSSYDRGINHLLERWAEVRAEVPDAELHLFYGWNTYDEMMKVGRRPKVFRDAMTKLMQQEGVFEHGRIGHKQLVKEFAKSGIWAYPSHFEEISCCVGDTPILMPRDHQLYPYGIPIKELVGKKDFYVYSYNNENGKIELGKVLWVDKTKKNAELLKITLDDGTILRFTPNHKFMLRNEEYKEAKDLKIGDSLMPCYERPTFAIKQPSGEWDFEHRILGEKMFGNIKGMHIDHKNGNRYNNSPENLVAISPSNHAKKSFKDRVFTEKGTIKRIANNKKTVRERYTKEERSEWAKKQCKNMWDKVNNMNLTDKEAWLKERGKKRRETEKIKVSLMTVEEKKERLNNLKVKGKAGAMKRWYNHKIISIEKDIIKEDVYDMEVEKYHNFAAGGVFVHNCISAMKAQAMGCIPVCTDFAALKETVKDGILIKGSCEDKEVENKFIEALIGALKQPIIVNIDKEQFGWNKVAKQWSDNLFVFKRREYKDYEDYKSYYVTPGEFKTSNFAANGDMMQYPRYTFVLETIKKNGLKSLLDAGCSDGVLCFLANKTLGIEADGIDADKKTVEFANKYAEENKLGCKFENCLLEELSPNTEKYECASALEIIEHVINPKEFLNRLESHVIDGGYIIISTPEKDGYYGEKNFNDQHINHFTKESLAELIGKERIVEWANSPELLLVSYRK